MFTEPELGLRSRGSEGLCEIFLRDHRGSLDCRVRNYIAGHTDADEGDADSNDHSDGELRDAATHVRPRPLGEHVLCLCGYNYPALSNKPVTHFTGAA